MPYKRLNRLEYYGAMAAANSFAAGDSSSRLAMMSHHLAQAVTPKQSDIPSILTGLETQLEAFGTVMPVDGIITSIHHKFRRGFDQDAIKSNPYTTIIYQCQETGTYDCLNVQVFHSTHRVFGSKQVLSPILSQIRPGFYIAKGTPLATSPNIKEGGIYSNGLSVSIANISLPCTIEDGYGASKSFCERAGLLEMSTSVGSWGRRSYPLNTYGDIYHFKAYPDIGDRIRPDGLVFAFREYHDSFNALEMTNEALMHVDMSHDIRVYGLADSIVYDIVVESGIGESTAKQITPPALAVQSNRYIKHIMDYYDGIKESWAVIRKQRNYSISPRLNNLIISAFASTPNKHRSKNEAGGIIRRTYDGSPLDEFRVEIKSTKQVPIDVGSKITGLDGNKGIVVKVIDDEDMPTDIDGNRADVVTYSKAVIARLNPAQLYHQYVGAACRDMRKWIIANYGVIPLEQIWDKLMRFYEAATPITYDIMKVHYTSTEDRSRHLDSIINSKLSITIPIDSPNIGPSIFKNIEAVISPTYGPVTYRDLTGRMVTTKNKVFIGVQQMIVLEKTDHRPMAVASGVLQHHGLLAGSNKASRTGHPSKVQAMRVYSESEVLMYAAGYGGVVLAELLVKSNSPEVHKMLILQVLEAENPSRLPALPKITNVTSRPLLYVRNVSEGFGLSMKSRS